MKNLVVTTMLTLFLLPILIAQPTESLQQTVLTNRDIPDTWDQEMLQSDLKIQGQPLGPLTFGAFPTPQYDLIGENAFRGIGNFLYPGVQGYTKHIADKTILFNSFFINKNSLNKDRLGEKPNEVFFQIIALTDFIDSTGFSHIKSQILSRNHPDFVGQGTFKTADNQIDYVAFQTVTGEAFALVNMRLFDLSDGKTILIAPHQDGSMRSLQLSSPLLSSEEIDAYTDQLLRQERVIQFFTADGTIGG